MVGLTRSIRKSFAPNFSRILTVSIKEPAVSTSSSKIIAYDDLGTEAIRQLTVENFPAVVVIDRKGNKI